MFGGTNFAISDNRVHRDNCTGNGFLESARQQNNENSQNVPNNTDIRPLSSNTYVIPLIPAVNHRGKAENQTYLTEMQQNKQNKSSGATMDNKYGPVGVCGYDNSSSVSPRSLPVVISSVNGLGGSRWVSSSISHHQNNNDSSIDSCDGRGILISSYAGNDATHYCKEIPMRVRMCSNREQILPLTVRLNRWANAERLSFPNLHIELTNESDPYFLYFLDVDENFFHRLKSEQSLLVDFNAFPSKFIDLLEKCPLGSYCSEITNTSQRLSAVFSDEIENQHLRCGSSDYQNSLPRGPPYRQQTQTHQQRPLSMGGSVGGVVSASSTSFSLANLPQKGRLDLVETNQFKELTHLSLILLRGDDAYIKQHLAKKLNDKKSELKTASAKIYSLESRLRGLEEQREHLAGENKRLITEHENRLSKTKQELQDEKVYSEKSLKTKIETLKARAVLAEEKVSQLTENIARLTSNQELLQSTLATTQEKLSTSQNELTLQQIKVKSLEPLKDCNEKTISELSTKLEVLQQKEAAVKELLDKKEALHEESHVEKSNAQKHAKELEAKLSTCAKEINRGNEIIAKQQGQIRSMKTKIKSKVLDNQIHEKNVSEKEATIQSLKKVIVEFENPAEKLKVVQAELQELKKTIETKQTVIENLNNQLTEKEVQTILQNLPPHHRQHVPKSYAAAVSSAPSLASHIQSPLLSGTFPLPKFPNIQGLQDTSPIPTAAPVTRFDDIDELLNAECRDPTKSINGLSSNNFLGRVASTSSLLSGFFQKSNSGTKNSGSLTSENEKIINTNNRDGIGSHSAHLWRRNSSSILIPPSSAPSSLTSTSASTTTVPLSTCTDGVYEYQPHPVPTQHV